MVDDLTNAAADGIEAGVRPSTVGIVSGSGPQKWQGIGTGTMVRWMGRRLILTADHVVGDTSSDDLRFFFPQDAPPITVEREELLALPGVPTALLKPFSQIRLGPIFRDSSLDLAALEVNASVETTYPVRFFDLAEHGSSPVDGQTTVLIGFPYDLTRLTHDDARVVFTQVEWSRVEPARGGLEGFDADVHFLAHYSPPTTYPGADPRGLSGSAMWARKGDTPGVWHPNLELGGVTITYYSSARLLKMVRRERVEEFLRASMAA